MNVTLEGALRQFICISFWRMTCQHHCQAQCHSAVSATETITLQNIINTIRSNRQSVRASCWIPVLFSFIRSSSFVAAIFIIAPISGFVLLGCWALAHEASVHTVCVWKIKDTRASKQVEHRMSSSTIYIASCARPSCRHLVFPPGPSPWFSVETRLHFLDVSSSEQFQSQHGITFAS